jgi:hypothetical protein
VPLNSNGSYFIVACVFVAVGMCLPSPCLAMNVYSDSSVPAFGGHVTTTTTTTIMEVSQIRQSGQFRLTVMESAPVKNRIPIPRSPIPQSAYRSHYAVSAVHCSPKMPKMFAGKPEGKNERPRLKWEDGKLTKCIIK